MDDNLSILLGITTTILTVITIILSYQNNRLQKTISTEQGVFRKPSLTISIFNSERRKKSNFIPHYFIVAGKLPSKGFLSLPLIINVKNEGEKSAKEIKLALRYPKRLRGGGAKIEPADDYSKERSPKYINDSNFQIALHEIGTLTPNEELIINDVITINEATFLKYNVDVVTKDNVPVIIPVEISWFNNIDYTIYQDDIVPISGSIKIFIVDTSKQSLEEYLLSYNKQRFEKYTEQIGNTIMQLLHYCKMELTGKQIEREIQFVLFDEINIKRDSKKPLYEVPIEYLKYKYGLEDISGAIHILD